MFKVLKHGGCFGGRRQGGGVKPWWNVGTGSGCGLHDIGHQTLAKQTLVNQGEGIFRSGGGEGLETIT